MQKMRLKREQGLGYPNLVTMLRTGVLIRRTLGTHHKALRREQHELDQSPRENTVIAV